MTDWAQNKINFMKSKIFYDAKFFLFFLLHNMYDHASNKIKVYLIVKDMKMKALCGFIVGFYLNRIL